jgi:hypothetical protein
MLVVTNVMGGTKRPGMGVGLVRSCRHGRDEVLAKEADVPVRRSSIVLATVGIVVIVLGVVLRFVVVPIATQLPASTKLGITYSGTATLLNSQALQSGDIKNVIATNVPITIDRLVKVTSTHGDTAVVSDNLTIHAGSESLPSPHDYALNRTSLKGVAPPKGVSVEPSKGALSSTFPIGPKANNSYRYYDSSTRQIVPITYTGHATLDGRSVNVYKFAATGPVKDPGLLKILPSALPKNLMAGLAPLLPPAVRAEITPSTLAALSDPIPLTYTAKTNIVAYVDRQTGVPINETIAEQIVVNVAAGSQSLSLIPVLVLDFQVSPASMRYLAHKAKTAGELLTLIKVIVPIALIAIGGPLLVVSIIRRRRPQSTPPSLSAAANGSQSEAPPCHAVMTPQ